MRKTAKHIVMALLLSVLTVTGCSRPASADFYIEGTDFQYQYYNRSLFTTGMVRGKDTIYFTLGSYIYQLDEGTGTVSPLCNKPNCLHDKEIDKHRMSECNAYTNEIGITYMNGYIYVLMDGWEDDDHSDKLYRIAGDGSAREKVYQWEGSIAEGWCLHRDVLYYVEHTYDESNREHYAVKAMKLTGTGKLRPETIWEPEEDVTVYAMQTPQAYGNHLYININGTKAKNLEDMQSVEGVLKYSYTKTFQYNLQDETLTEIQVPGQLDTEQINQVTFWQGKIVYQAFDIREDHQYDAVTDVYIADLDGGNAKVLLKDMPLYRWYTSDGTYLYVSNCTECRDKIFSSQEFQENMDDIADMKFDYQMKIDVYDKDMELVDSMGSPFHSMPPVEPSYGIGDRMYVNVEDDSGVYLEYWDKTKLGTYHGGEYELVEVGKITNNSTITQ